MDMRKISANFFISLDGVVESPDKWHFPYFNEEMGQAVEAGMKDSDAMLLGRKTYEEWAAYWPNTSADEPFSDYINNIPKYVASTTLQTAEWHNSTLLRGDLATELGKLKSEPGKNIAMSGSITLVRWLLANDLLDELRLLVHPIVVSQGQRLFLDEIGNKPLKLASATTFETGVLNLVYQRP
jgi:dihydrofolate reductase